MSSQRRVYAWYWETGSMSAAFTYLKNCHPGRKYCVLSRGKETNEKHRKTGFGRFPEEFGCLSSSVNIILTLRWWNRLGWVSAELWEFSWVRRFTWVISKVCSKLEKLWAFQEDLSYLKWGVPLYMCPSAPAPHLLFLSALSILLSSHSLLSCFKSQMKWLDSTCYGCYINIGINWRLQTMHYLYLF